VALRYAARVGGITELALTKLDVLTGFDQIRVCVGYGNLSDPNTTLTSKVLTEAVPVYTDLPGWIEGISHCRRFEDLPANARFYVEMVSQFTRLPVTAIGVGPEREQLIHH